MRRSVFRLAAPVLASLCLCLPALAETSVPSSEAQIALSFAPVARAAAPAVVNIYATVVVQERFSPFANDPFFGQFFEEFGQSAPRLENSLGSGVIVSDDGLVVSNYHVVAQATEIRVVLADRREFTARVLLADEDSDLAVLQMEDANGLPALAFRDSDEVEVGELVLAIGNPFGVGQTVSSGIISALARSGIGVGGGRGYFIQTDAAINPGNSGGALVDMAGRLVGINTAILTRSGGSNGIGFAIPSNLVQNFVDQAKAGAARFQRPWAGVAGQAVDASMAEAMGLSRPEGVVLTDVHPESPFRKAGLAAGDVILTLGGERTDSPQEVLFRMSAEGIGKTLPVTYLRDGTVQEAEVAMIAPPESPPREALTLTGNVVLRGLSVARINPAVTAELGLPINAAGVAVIAAEDRAARAGLKAGDIILSINGAAIGTTADVQRSAEAQVRRWAVDVIRDGRLLRLRFRL